MIPYFKKSLQEWRERFEEHSFWKHSPLILLGFVFALSTIFMFPSSQALQFANLEKGDVYTDREIIAPFTFFINKNEDEIAQDRKFATEEVPLVFNRVDSIEQLGLQRFDDFYQEIQSIRETTSAQDSAKIKTIRDILDDYSILIDQPNTLLKSDFSSEGTNASNSRKIKRENFNYLMQTLRRIIQDIYAIGILNLPVENIPFYISKLSVVTTDIETIQDYSNYSNLSDYQYSILENLRQTFPDHNAAVKIGYPIVTAFVNPNLIFDQNETDRRINDAVSNVPLSKGFVLENERIVNTHEIITEEILEKLNSLASAKAEKEAREGSGFSLLLPYIGKILIVSLSLSFLVMFLMISRKDIFNNFKKMFMIFIIFMFMIGTTFLINQFDSVIGLKYLIPIAIASMLLTIFFDTRIAFIGTVTLSIIIGALRGNDFGLMVISLFIGTISTFVVREIQSRSWILRGMLILSAGYLISIGTIEFLKHSQLQIWEFWLFGLINGVLSPLLTYGVMIIFEYVFNVTTYSTLLELSDLNKPLLRQLAIRAPGTYHHSIMVGNLSEAACEAIGANALLARVAAYYHDIGKMEKPDYFVENQKGGKNPHESLSPNMSCLILISHVKKGLEIAEQYNLPQEICDFIPQHHGTNLIQYFYQKALESKPDNQINEADYRYHGPKPQTKEAGVVMLSDAIEAGSRSLKDPSVSRIRNMVDSFVHERLVDSELDECPLTLRDLNLIKDSFVNNLIGMFHGRIEYPKKEKTIFRKNNQPSKKKILEAARSHT